MSAPSEADLRRIFDRSPIGIYRSTADGRFLYVNPALVAMLGYDSAAELLALDLTTAIYADPDERRPLVERYLTAGVLDGVDVVWRHRDGRQLIVRLYGHAIAGENGTPAGFDVQVVDVTALRAAEGNLRQQRAATEQALLKLRSVMTQMPVMVWTCDRELRFTSIEGSAYVGSVVPIGARMERLLNGTALEQGLHAHHRALDGQSSTFEGEFDDKIWLVTVAPMRDADGVVIGVIGSSIDVTMMRQVERNVQQTQRIESLGVLAGGVAHDFNNLLVAMLGNADRALRAGIAETESRHAVEAVRTAALRASELTSQLLAYSGRGQLAMSTVDMAPLVSEMIGLLVPGRRGVLRLEVEPGLPPVRADAPQIRQVVLNLVTNAFDALRDGLGEVRVRVRVVDAPEAPHPHDVVSAAPGRHVAIEVGDDGVGMDTATRRKIFDPFYTTKPTGHGLGLAAVLGIVRGHRGGLRLSSQLGQGATFEVLLPIDHAAAVLEPAPARPPRVEHSKTILIVDDEEIVREVVCNMVEDLGYRAVAATCGDEALALADDGGVALHAAIVDLTMPHMNGCAVIDGLRSRRPALPVILTSGYDRDRVEADGAAGFLRKPFRFETLEVLLAEVLGS